MIVYKTAEKGEMVFGKFYIGFFGEIENILKNYFSFFLANSWKKTQVIRGEKLIIWLFWPNVTFEVNLAYFLVILKQTANSRFFFNFF